MASKTAFTHALVVLAVGLAAAGSGCSSPLSTACGPSIQAPWPLPVSPYFQDKFEDRYYEKERYGRVPILGPITEGAEIKALDPPSPDEVIRAMEKANPTEGGLPFLHEVQRNNVRMTIEPIADYVDPPRVYPTIGPAQLHHAHYKCTLFYTEITRVGWPIPYTTIDEDAREVLYIDHNHFHRVGNISEDLPPVGIGR